MPAPERGNEWPNSFSDSSQGWLQSQSTASSTANERTKAEVYDEMYSTDSRLSASRNAITIRELESDESARALYGMTYDVQLTTCGCICV